MAIYFKLLFAMLVWGGTFTSARLLGNELDPAVSAFLRFLLASSFLLALLYFKKGRFPRVNKKQFLFLFGMGLTGVALYNLFFFYGLVHTEAGRGSLITATINPILIALGAAFIFKERFTFIRVFGFLLCITGAILIITKGDFSSLVDDGIGKGELAFIGSAFSWATYTLIGRFMSDKLSSLATIAYASSIGTVILFFAALNADLFTATKTLSMNAGLHLLYLALLATVLSFVWFQDGVKELGAAKAAVFVYFMPVSAVFWAWLILDEKFTLILAMGAALVISGIYLVNKKEAS
ncbi:MAG: DMT family transporter [Cocleimonas sp.]|nr:DMT family transporter [Cocleimonas sp.]